MRLGQRLSHERGAEACSPSSFLPLPQCPLHPHLCEVVPPAHVLGPLSQHVQVQLAAMLVAVPQEQWVEGGGDIDMVVVCLTEAWGGRAGKHCISSMGGRFQQCYCRHCTTTTMHTTHAKVPGLLLLPLLLL